MSFEALRAAIDREMKHRPGRTPVGDEARPEGQPASQISADGGPGPAAMPSPMQAAGSAASPVATATAATSMALPPSPLKSRLERIPLLGKLAWWVHALFKAPARIRDLNTLRHLDTAARERALEDLRGLVHEINENTRQSRAETRTVTASLDTLSGRLDRVVVGLEQQAGALEAEARRRGDTDRQVAALGQSLGERVAEVERGLRQAAASTRALDDRRQADRDAQGRRHDELSAALSRAEEATAGLGEAVTGLRTFTEEALHARQWHAEDLEARLAAAKADTEAAAVDQRRLQEQLGRSATETKRALARLQSHLALPEHAPGIDDLNRFYQDLETRFRGPEEVIKKRQSIYLPTIREAGAGTDERPALDLGCGRGEWLSTLRDEGLVGRGVDSNARVVEACTAAALSVTEGDLLAHLEGLVEASHGAVTAFQVVEHMPFEALFRLVDEIHRVLHPGGVVILETPNPANLLVAANWFHLDPSHRSLIPRELLEFLLEQRGFERTETRELHPATEADVPGPDNPLGSFLSGPQDYAVIGWKKDSAER